MTQVDHGRRLTRLGFVLFVVGLLTGLVEQKLANPRMGLSAHLEGVMNGTFLIAFGAAWGHFTLSERRARVISALAVYGAYANCAGTLAAAAFGTRAMTPIAGAGFEGAPWQELLVTALLVSCGVAMLASSVMAVAALRARGA